MTRSGVSASLLALMLAACSSSTEAPTPDAGQGTPTPAGACMHSDVHQCVDYVGPNFPAEAIESSCTQGGGTYLAAGCPVVDLLGSCRLVIDAANESIMRFYTGHVVASKDLPSTFCGDGVWIAP